MTKLLKQPSNAKIVSSSTNTRLIAERLGRFALIGAFSIGIGTAAVYDRYKNYWEKTIYRVQTVDFNMLSHTLPTKLSYTIIKNQPQELQRTLNSNYGLFGLVVTDPTGQKIIASSQSPSSKTVPDTQQLQKHPYDLLLDPPPVYPQWTYSDPRAVERSATNLTNRGRVIGRIYYVRGEIPSFGDDVVKWLSKPLSPSSRAETFTITITALLLSGLSFWLFWEHLLYKKRVQKLEAEEREKTLIEQKDILLLQLRERISQIKDLQNQWEQERKNSLNQADKLSNYNQQLSQEIGQVRAIMSVSATTISDTTQLQELEQAKTEVERGKNKQHQQESQIKQLNQNLQIYQNQLEEARKNGESLKQLQSQIESIETARSLAELELKQLENKEKSWKQAINNLENQLASQNTVQSQLNRQLKILQQTLDESRLQEKESKEKAETANKQIEMFTEEMERLKEDMGQHPLNDFEKAVLVSLESNLPQVQILTQFDAGTRDDNSKFIDFLIVMDSCVIAIEAKFYKGRIEPVGDPRNTNWVCQIGNNKKLINSCWGRNPYQQVKTYTDAILARTGKRGRNQHQTVFVYGVVVFPSEASITSEIKSNIGGFYRVTTLNNLLSTIRELKANAESRNSNTMNCQQISSLLRLNVF